MTGLYSELYPWDFRKKKLRYRVLYMILHSLTTAYITMLILAYWNAWEIECIREINVWLCVYLVVQFILTVCAIVQVCLWLCANDPPLGETKLRLYLQYLVYTFTAGWIIYGSTFMFSDEIKDCKEPVSHGFKPSDMINVKALRITAIVLIAQGYLTLLWLLCLCCFGCAMYCLYTSWMRMDTKTQKAWKDREMDAKTRQKNERIREKTQAYEQDHSRLLSTVKALKKGKIPSVTKMSGSKAHLRGLS